MAEFRSMTVVVQSTKTFTETGKDVPTYELPHLHTIELEDHHDTSQVEMLFDRLDMAHYKLVSLVVDGYDFTEELVKHVYHLSNVSVFFTALINDPYCADVICAFVTERDCADVENWADSVYFSGLTHEDIVREWAEIFHKVYEPIGWGYSGPQDYVEAPAIPSWATMDWADTLDTIARNNSSSVVEFGGMVYYFGE